MVKSLNNKWKEFLFAFSGFGPNFLMVLMGAYFTDAINPAAFTNQEVPLQTISGACYILPAVFPVLYMLSKIFDGLIDIPLAHLTDNLSTRWGRRRPAIAVCLIPMTVSFGLCWLPIGGEEGQLVNTLWIIFWALVFFATYTMCLIAFYGSLSTVCENESQRLRVSGYKSFFDTISYCVVYALVPLLLDGLQMHIDKFVFCCLPLMGTMLIPLFLIKEGAKYGYPENEGLAEKQPSLIESIKLTFTNRVFLRWLVVNCCTFFGLQMFLVSMNTMIVGGMGMSGAEMALLNTCAFAPVPVMLYLFNKVKAKKGIRFTYQTCLISFAIAIMSFFFGSLFVTGGNKTVQYIIGCLGGVFASWAIGAFFMMPYHVTAQVSSVEERLTKKNHSAMYFAANAVVTSVIGAISSSLIYENIKMLFISKETFGVVYALNIGEAAAEFTKNAGFQISEASVFNLGTLLVPFIVAAVCILGAVLAIKMPRDYTPKLVARELKRFDPSLDISSVENDDGGKEERGEILFVQIGLSVLSGFIFGFIWTAYLFKAIKEFVGGRKIALAWALSCFVPFASVYYVLKAHKELKLKGERYGKKYLKKPWYAIQRAMFIVTCIIFPILPVNVLALSFLQRNINQLYALEDAEAVEAAPTAEAAL